MACGASELVRHLTLGQQVKEVPLCLPSPEICAKQIEVFPFGSDTVLDSEVPHHGVLRVAMDAEDEDDNQSLVDVLERDLTLQDSDTDSLEVHSTQSQAPDDFEREDNCSEAGSEVLPPAELEPDPPLMRPSAAAMRAGLPLLDGEDLSQMFSHRAAVMKAVPKFLWGSFRIALKLALKEVAI